MSTDRKMNDPPQPAWHELAEQATREDDAEKLCRLVEEICDSIDAAQAKKRPKTASEVKAVESSKS